MPSIIMFIGYIKYEAMVTKRQNYLNYLILCTQLTFHTVQGHDLEQLYLEYDKSNDMPTNDIRFVKIDG